MASNYKNPTKFDPKTTLYETWKNEFEIWPLVTDLPPNKQALAASQTLSGTARETVLELSAADLNKNDGMTTLVGKLDKLFLKEAKDCTYEVYQNFDSFCKSDKIIMTDYIIEFEQKYTKSKRYGITQPDAVLVFKLFDNASLTVKERQLALTASADLIFASMKSALGRICLDKSTCTQEDETIQVKQETVYAAQEKKFSYKSLNNTPGTSPINKLYNEPSALSFRVYFIGPRIVLKEQLVLR